MFLKILSFLLIVLGASFPDEYHPMAETDPSNVEGRGNGMYLRWKPVDISPGPLRARGPIGLNLRELHTMTTYLIPSSMIPTE